MIFDTIELVTLGISLLSLIFILNAYKNNLFQEKSQILWKNFLFFSVFLFLNRIFTNIEVLFWKTGFNFLEHLSIVIAAGFIISAVSLADRMVKRK
jgi:hypothetical protein